MRSLMLAGLLALSPALAAGGAERSILVLGDSLSAAYGIPAEAGWVALLADRLAPLGYRVVNASLSGET
ncbi:MAG: hypothetical protein NZN28_14630, partial [Meiothermus sp.]|nr:hypothetical protein [Meiothermus sp.]